MIVRGRSPGHYNDSDPCVSTSPTLEACSPPLSNVSTSELKHERADEVDSSVNISQADDARLPYANTYSPCQPWADHSSERPLRIDHSSVPGYGSSFTDQDYASRQKWPSPFTRHECNNVQGQVQGGESSGQLGQSKSEGEEEGLLQLPPLQWPDRDPSSVPRLPTFDELIARKSNHLPSLSLLTGHASLQSDPIFSHAAAGSRVSGAPYGDGAAAAAAAAEEQSQELQAALSLASICQSFPTQKPQSPYHLPPLARHVQSTSGGGGGGGVEDDRNRDQVAGESGRIDVEMRRRSKRVRGDGREVGECPRRRDHGTGTSKLSK